jgi:hypothetical protein
MDAGETRPVGLHAIRAPALGAAVGVRLREQEQRAVARAPGPAVRRRVGGEHGFAVRVEPDHAPAFVGRAAERERVLAPLVFQDDGRPQRGVGIGAGVQAFAADAPGFAFEDLGADAEMRGVEDLEAAAQLGALAVRADMRLRDQVTVLGRMQVALAERTGAGEIVEPELLRVRVVAIDGLARVDRLRIRHHMRVAHELALEHPLEALQVVHAGLVHRRPPAMADQGRDRREGRERVVGGDGAGQDEEKRGGAHQCHRPSTRP